MGVLSVIGVTLVQLSSVVDGRPYSSAIAFFVSAGVVAALLVVTAFFKGARETYAIMLDSLAEGARNAIAVAIACHCSAGTRRAMSRSATISMLRSASST